MNILDMTGERDVLCGILAQHLPLPVERLEVIANSIMEYYTRPAEPSVPDPETARNLLTLQQTVKRLSTMLSATLITVCDGTLIMPEELLAEEYHLHYYHQEGNPFVGVWRAYHMESVEKQPTLFDPPGQEGQSTT